MFTKKPLIAGFASVSTIQLLAAVYVSGAAQKFSNAINGLLNDAKVANPALDVYACKVHVNVTAPGNEEVRMVIVSNMPDLLSSQLVYSALASTGITLDKFNNTGYSLFSRGTLSEDAISAAGLLNADSTVKHAILSAVFSAVNIPIGNAATGVVDASSLLTMPAVETVAVATQRVGAIGAFIKALLAARVTMTASITSLVQQIADLEQEVIDAGGNASTVATLRAELAAYQVSLADLFSNLDITSVSSDLNHDGVIDATDAV